MIGHIEKENLRRADQQHGLDARRLRWQTAVEKQSDKMPQRSEPAQHGCDQRPRQRAVALVERGKTGCSPRIGAVEKLVERPMPAQHAIDDIGGDVPDGQAGHCIDCTRGTSRRLARGLHRTFLIRIARNVRGIMAEV